MTHTNDPAPHGPPDLPGLSWQHAHAWLPLPASQVTAWTP